MSAVAAAYFGESPMPQVPVPSAFRVLFQPNGRQKNVLYTTDGEVKVIDWKRSLCPSLEEMYAVIKCKQIESLSFVGGLTLVFDEDGLYSSIRNTRFAEEFGHLPTKNGALGVFSNLYGNVLVMRTDVWLE